MSDKKVDKYNQMAYVEERVCAMCVSGSAEQIVQSSSIVVSEFLDRELGDLRCWLGLGQVKGRTTSLLGAWGLL